MRGVNSRAFVSNDGLVVVVVDGAEAVSTRSCFLYDECCCPFSPCCRCCWRSGLSSSLCWCHLYSGSSSSGVGGVVGCRSPSGRPLLTLDVAGEYFVAAGGGWCLACCCCADDSASSSSSLAAHPGCSCWRRRWPCIRCRRCRSSCWCCCCRLLSKWCPSGSCWQRQWTGSALVVLKHTQLVAHCACGESSTSLVWCRSPTASALRGCGHSGVAPPNRGRPITYGVKAACGSLHYQKGIQDRAFTGSLSLLSAIYIQPAILLCSVWHYASAASTQPPVLLRCVLELVAVPPHAIHQTTTMCVYVCECELLLVPHSASQ